MRRRVIADAKPRLKDRFCPISAVRAMIVGC